MAPGRIDNELYMQYKKSILQLNLYLWIQDYTPHIKNVKTPNFIKDEESSLIKVLFLINNFLGLLAIFLTGIIYILGINEVNSKYKDLIESFNAKAEKHSREILNFDRGQVKHYNIESNSDQKFIFLKPYTKYKYIHFAIGETSISIFDSAELNMKNLDFHLGESTKEFYYDQISNVQYKNGYFEIRTSSGDSIRYKSSRDPGDILNHLQRKIRQHKRNK